MARTWTQNHLDALWINIGSINSRTIFLLQLAETVRGSWKVIDQLKMVKIEGLSDDSSIGGGPVRNIGRTHNVCLDFARDAHHTHFGPLFTAGRVKFTEELLDGSLETFHFLRRNERQRLNFDRVASVQIQLAKSQADVRTADITD